MTDAEKKLWWQLRALPLEHGHFRRQATIGPYFVDFACHERRLVIEVDGSGHSDPNRATRDSTRTAFLSSFGYRVLRFWNNEVLCETDAVMAAIFAALSGDADATPPTPNPSPPLGHPTTQMRRGDPARGGRGTGRRQRRS
jgi:very-short-patch-repair endonuclease